MFVEIKIEVINWKGPNDQYTYLNAFTSALKRLDLDVMYGFQTVLMAVANV